MSSFDMPDTPVSSLQRNVFALSRRFQYFLDKTLPYPAPRWGTMAVLLVLFLLRVFHTHGWYIVTYALGIYLLQLFLLFLTPKLDPAMENLDDEDDLDVAGAEGGVHNAAATGHRRASFLPTNSGEDFRPFIRRLPEFKFWWKAMRAVMLACFCSLFEAFNVPVFWPILVVYFFALFAVTMRRQIRHMIKYKYLPWNAAKPNYARSSVRRY
ncbi:retrieval of early ER protein Rer1 [Blastocladiella britannica]|nr:retrieval of early ER protein Rer1 [Blastocladiella britannica]